MRSKVIEKGWLEDDLKKAQKELKEAKEYILAQEAYSRISQSNRD